MQPTEGAAAAATLLQAMNKTTDPDALRDLARGLSALAVRMEPTEAAAVCTTASATLLQTMSKATNAISLSSLARDLSVLSVRMEPKEAVEVCGTAAPMLVLVMTQATDDTALLLLARGLSALSAQMEAKEATVTLILEATVELQEGLDVKKMRAGDRSGDAERQH